MSHTIRNQAYEWQGWGKRKECDGKPFYKPSKSFKKLRSRIRKAKIKMAIKMGKDPEHFRKSDVWDWL